MADRYADLIEIAGVSFTGCKGLLLDGDGFADPVRGSIDWSIDSTPVEQVLDTQLKGTQFGVALGTDGGANLISEFNNTLYAITRQLREQGWFSFVWQDQQYNIDAKVRKDWSQRWYQYGKYSAGYLESVVFRFVVLEANLITLSTEEDI